MNRWFPRIHSKQIAVSLLSNERVKCKFIYISERTQKESFAYSKNDSHWTTLSRSCHFLLGSLHFILEMTRGSIATLTRLFMVLHPKILSRRVSYTLSFKQNRLVI